MKIFAFIDKKEPVKTYVKFVYDGSIESANHMQWLLDQSKLHKDVSLCYNLKSKRLTSMPVNRLLSIGVNDFFVYDYFKKLLYTSRSNNNIIPTLNETNKQMYHIKELTEFEKFDLKQDLSALAKLLIL